MHSLQLLSKQELGGYKVRVIQSGNRYAIWLGSDALPLFENVKHFWVAWVENKIGESVIFSPHEEKWATRTTLVMRENGLIVGIPESYRKWMGLRKGSVVRISYIRFQDKVGFLLEVED